MQYGIKQYIFVIRELTAREIKRKYSRSVLGILWSVLNPLLFMGVMSMVFWGISGNAHYPVYYITGYTIWNMFNTATTTSITVFEDNRNFFQKTKLPRVVFVLSRNYTAFINTLFSFIALLISLFIFRVKISASMVMFFVAVIYELVFAVGVSFILATIYVFYKDIKFIWQNVIVILVHMLGIYIPIDSYPEFVKPYTEANPLFIFSDVARNGVLDNQFGIDRIGVMTLWAIGTLVVGVIFFKCAEAEIVKKM